MVGSFCKVCSTGLDADEAVSYINSIPSICCKLETTSSQEDHIQATTGRVAVLCPRGKGALQMIVWGHIKDNQILLDENIQLPDGVRVEIRVPDETTTQVSGLCGIWKDSRDPKEIVEEVISSRTLGRDTTL